METLAKRYPHILTVEGEKMFCAHCKRAPRWWRNDYPCDDAPGYQEALKGFLFINVNSNDKDKTQISA